MATSGGIEGCMLQRGRSQSDPNILTETSIDQAHSTDVMDQQRALRSGCLVTGVRTPPIRRNSKLATLGRIFRPWKWRKKKNEKLKQSSTALGGKAAARKSQDELVRKGLAEILKADSALACGTSPEEPGTPTQEQSDGEERDEESLVSQVNLKNMEDLGSEEDSCPVRHSSEDDEVAVDQSDNVGEETENEKDGTPADSPACSLIGAVVDQERAVEGGEDPPNGDPSPSAPPAVPVKLLTRLGSLEAVPVDPGKTSPSSKTSILPKETPWGPETVRGQGSTPTGSPHLGVLQPQLPPSCIIEELHRALATKHRQDSFHSKEIRLSPKRRSDGRLSRTSSTEKESAGDAESKKESDENKENLRLDEYYSDTSGLLHDQDSWNESVISGTLPRRMRKELLAIKLRNRPSKQELEDRNIFPTRSDQERQEIRQQIEMKLAKRLSQRPGVEELESRNILKQRNDQTEQEERREIKQRLNRKLNQRPTVDELRDRKILIRFSDYVEVAKAQDYDRRADKPWTRLSAADKAAIRKELNEFKSNEMEVHASSKHLTRFHRP
ncbi:phosphatase and actin regulator 3-like isoform X2 [Brienomyrus brachyistius]|uniref:phosphatase and actin regulator 3-like isoform X2 n=1 Tax=Brienomyrus brachyistius TaxID=42636 RepID=UPI0020B39F12|nr:phosphatase and actin regulator 3-like isoform X2 [Brienomyrus brachyistius]